jgi:hypothetical protein
MAGRRSFKDAEKAKTADTADASEIMGEQDTFNNLINIGLVFSGWLLFYNAKDHPGGQLL